MQTKRRELFTTVHTEGAILPADLLKRIVDNDSGLGGLNPDDYHCSGERLNEVINGAWNRLLGQWQTFQSAFKKLPENDAATSVTRERWLLPLFRELDYGRLSTVPAVEIEGKLYPISHGWQKTPIHLVGWGIELDRRTPGVAGASKTSPHSLVQEFLNRSNDHLWAFLSNGKGLRILRDNVSLTRQAYVEFDLESMMNGEVYADFALLWLLCHQSRVECKEGERPEQCWLEKWSRAAQESGTRALESLRKGVEDSIKALGRGFLAYPENSTLRDKLYSGNLPTQDYYRQLLRMVYRLLFLFVAEDRNLLLTPDANEKTRERFARFYSTARLRRLAERHRGTRHCDHFHAFLLVMQKLGSVSGCPELGLPALGSFLWSEKAVADLVDCRLSNVDFLSAVRALAFAVDQKTLRAVDYRNLGAEELGSVYESLLELHPKLSADAGTFELDVAAGHERKTTGSYYTPTSLINCLLDSALDPVLDEAAKKSTVPEAESAILNLKICDPACGSGHFLIAAAHRVAKRLAAIRTGDEEPAPEATRHALRDVIGHCIYGVDINPMAVELCKINLWLESLEPGRPLSFLDHHIQCGNSLLGTTPALLKKGIPNDAFSPIEGDDKKVCTQLKRSNQKERNDYKSGQGYLFSPPMKLGNLPTAIHKINQASDDSVEEVANKQKMYEDLVKGTDYLYARLLADTWCATFVWKKEDSELGRLCPTERIFRRTEDSPHSVLPQVKAETQRLARQYQFFHWHIAFPGVFQPKPDDQLNETDTTGWDGGFDCVLGNPPWERIKLQEKEWFANRSSEIASAPNAAARRQLINALLENDPTLHADFLNARRHAEGESILIRNSGRFPLCGRGDVNTYAIFTEMFKDIISESGRSGIIVPSGIATDDTTKFFFQELIESRSLVSLYDFENRKSIFPDVHQSYKFCLLTMGSAGVMPNVGALFSFFALEVENLKDHNRVFSLSAADIALLNPNTRTCPIFRTRCDVELTKHIYHRNPVLINENDKENGNPWEIKFSTMFHMSNDSHLFHTREELENKGWRLDGNVFVNPNTTADRFLPLYEAKMVGVFDHRCSQVIISKTAIHRQGQPKDLSLEQHQSPYCFPLPRYWTNEHEVDKSIPDDRKNSYFTGFANVTSSTNNRTVVPALIPKVAVGHSMPFIAFPNTSSGTFAAKFLGVFSSFSFDYVVRQKLGGINLTYFILNQLPVPVCATISAKQNDVVSRVLELTYTAWDLEPFAQDCGYNGPPFHWDEERRFLLRAELDAAFFHLYLGTPSEWGNNSPELREMFPTPRDAVDYIMETFPIVKRRDEQEHGIYRTKQVILDIYDAMSEAIQTGRPYQTVLDPPPGPPTDAEGKFIPMSEWDKSHWPSHIHQPRKAEVSVPTPTPELRKKAEAVLFTQLLLSEWGQPVLRENLECALILALNDGIRQKAMGATVPANYKPQQARHIPEFDRTLAAWERNGAISVENRSDGQYIALGATSVLQTTLATQYRQTAKSAVAALEALRDNQNLGYIMTQEDYDAIASIS